MKMVPSEASRWRVEFTRELIAHYTSNKAIKIIVLGGSAARGISDAYSDLDIVVYWDKIDLEWLETQPLSRVGGKHIMLRKMGESGIYLEEYFFNELKVDLGHITMDVWNQMVDEVLLSYKPEPDLQKTLEGFLEAIVLHGEEEYRKQREMIKAYPDELAVKMIRSNLGFYVRGYLINQALNRGDLLAYTDGVCLMLKKLLGILAGLNKVYFSTREPRWLEVELSKMAILPDNICERLTYIIGNPGQKAVDMLDALTDEVLDLVKTHRKDIDLTRFQRFYSLRVEACNTKPELIEPV
jgi:hypothetical protein